MNQHYKRFSLEYFLECQQKIGISNIELWCGATHFWLDHQGFGSVRDLKKQLRDRNLKVVSVTAPSMAYQYQYSYMEADGREKCYQYFSNGIRLASELGANIAVVNSGWGYVHEDPVTMWERTKEMLTKLAAVGEQEGVTLAMESLRNDETSIVCNIGSAKRMIEEINHPHLKAMVDTIATGAAGESLSLWFETFGKDLIHMHFLDGDPYVHNAWGDGNTPLEKQLKEINDWGYQGYLVQEIADDRYLSDPYEADIKNMRTLERYIEN